MSLFPLLSKLADREHVKLDLIEKIGLVFFLAFMITAGSLSVLVFIDRLIQ